MNSSFQSESVGTPKRCHAQLQCLTGTTEIVRVEEKLLHQCFLVFALSLAISLTSASGNRHLLLPSAGQGQLRTSKKLALLSREMEWKGPGKWVSEVFWKCLR